VFWDTGEIAADEATPFRPEVPICVLKQRLFGKSLTIGKLTGCLPALAFCITTTRPTPRTIDAENCRRLPHCPGSLEHVYLGDISAVRDWGSRIREAMYFDVAAVATGGLCVIATGESCKLEDFGGSLACVG